ncbi:MAG: hypothetical protein ACXWT4_12980 [Methylobacter sp.]
MLNDRVDSEHLFGAAVYPFLADADDRDAAFASLYAGRERKRQAEQKRIATPPLQGNRSREALSGFSVERMT